MVICGLTNGCNSLGTCGKYNLQREFLFWDFVTKANRSCHYVVYFVGPLAQIVKHLFTESSFVSAKTEFNYIFCNVNLE